MPFSQVAEALYWAHKQRATGLLTLAAAGREAKLFLRDGKVVRQELGFGHRTMAQALLLSRKVDLGTLDALWARQEAATPEEESLEAANIAFQDALGFQLATTVSALCEHAETVQFAEGAVEEGSVAIPASALIRSALESEASESDAPAVVYQCTDVAGCAEFLRGEDERKLLESLSSYQPASSLTGSQLSLLRLLEREGKASSLSEEAWRQAQQQAQARVDREREAEESRLRRARARAEQERQEQSAQVARRAVQARDEDEARTRQAAAESARLAEEALAAAKLVAELPEAEVAYEGVATLQEVQPALPAAVEAIDVEAMDFEAVEQPPREVTRIAYLPELARPPLVAPKAVPETVEVAAEDLELQPPEAPREATRIAFAPVQPSEQTPVLELSALETEAPVAPEPTQLVYVDALEAEAPEPTRLVYVEAEAPVASEPTRLVDLAGLEAEPPKVSEPTRITYLPSLEAPPSPEPTRLVDVSALQASLPAVSGPSPSVEVAASVAEAAVLAVEPTRLVDLAALQRAHEEPAPRTGEESAPAPRERTRIAFVPELAREATRRVDALTLQDASGAKLVAKAQFVRERLLADLADSKDPWFAREAQLALAAEAAGLAAREAKTREEEAIAQERAAAIAEAQIAHVVAEVPIEEDVDWRDELPEAPEEAFAQTVIRPIPAAFLQQPSAGPVLDSAEFAVEAAASAPAPAMTDPQFQRPPALTQPVEAPMGAPRMLSPSGPPVLTPVAPPVSLNDLVGTVPSPEAPRPMTQPQFTRPSAEALGVHGRPPLQFTEPPFSLADLQAPRPSTPEIPRSTAWDDERPPPDAASPRLASSLKAAADDSVWSLVEPVPHSLVSSPPSEPEASLEDSSEAKERRSRLLRRALDNLKGTNAPTETAVAVIPPPSPDAPPQAPILTAAEQRLAQDLERRYAQLASPSRDHFQILGLDRSASREQVKSAFLTLAKLFHPDRLPGSLSHLASKMTSVFESIREAYEILFDDAKRQAYAHNLGLSPAAPKPAPSESEARDFFKKGEVAFRKRDYVSAEQLFTRSHELHPSANAIAARAWALYMDPARKTEQPRAKQLMVDALKLEPTCDRALYQLGVVCRVEGDVEKAERYFKEAVKANPKHLEANQELRLIEMRKKSGGKKGGLFR